MNRNIENRYEDRTNTNNDIEEAKYKLEEEIFELHIFIENFVYSNWRFKNFSYNTKSLILEIEEEGDFYDDNLFYKDIVYI